MHRVRHSVQPPLLFSALYRVRCSVAVRGHDNVMVDWCDEHFTTASGSGQAEVVASRLTHEEAFMDIVGNSVGTISGAAPTDSGPFVVEVFDSWTVDGEMAVIPSRCWTGGDVGELTAA